MTDVTMITGLIVGESLDAILGPVDWDGKQRKGLPLQQRHSFQQSRAR